MIKVTCPVCEREPARLYEAVAKDMKEAEYFKSEHSIKFGHECHIFDTRGIWR